MTYTGWLLPEDDREKLLSKFPPTYPDVIAHHVTLQMGETALPLATTGVVVGWVDDGKGCQVLIVQIDGYTTRPDGATYHITWSIDRAQNRKPAHSLKVIEELDWTPVWPIYIHLEPKAFE